MQTNMGNLGGKTAMRETDEALLQVTSTEHLNVNGLTLWQNSEEHLYNCRQAFIQC